MNRATAGQLVTDLASGTNTQARNIAQIIQTERPEIILLNEFDHDDQGTAAAFFQQHYLSVGQNGAALIDYPYVYVAASNTGVDSGFDLNNSGVLHEADDAYASASTKGSTVSSSSASTRSSRTPSVPSRSSSGRTCPTAC